MSSSEVPPEVAAAKAFVDNFNAEYETKHLAFEQQFWGTKMALSSPEFCSENLSKTKKEKEDLLSDYTTVDKAKKLRDSLPPELFTPGGDTDGLVKCLDIIIRTCNCYSYSPEIKEIRESTNEMDSRLEMSRNRMDLGYINPNDGTFQSMSSVGLRNLMSTHADEAMRKAAYEGLRTVGPFVCQNGFVDIIKLRNKLAKALGFEDYYDYKVTNAEGMSKETLFKILDGLERGTRSIMEKSMQELEARHGRDALEPWNTTYMLSGRVVEKLEYVTRTDCLIVRYQHCPQPISFRLTLLLFRSSFVVVLFSVVALTSLLRRLLFGTSKPTGRWGSSTKDLL